MHLGNFWSQRFYELSVGQSMHGLGDRLLATERNRLGMVCPADGARFSAFNRGLRYPIPLRCIERLQVWIETFRLRQRLHAETFLKLVVVVPPPDGEPPASSVGVVSPSWSRFLPILVSDGRWNRRTPTRGDSVSFTGLPLGHLSCLGALRGWQACPSQIRHQTLISCIFSDC